MKPHLALGHYSQCCSEHHKEEGSTAIPSSSTYFRNKFKTLSKNLKIPFPLLCLMATGFLYFPTSRYVYFSISFEDQKEGVCQNSAVFTKKYDGHLPVPTPCQRQRWLIVLTTILIHLKTKPCAKRSWKDILHPNTGCSIEDSMKKAQKKESAPPKIEVLTSSKEW